jgi:hypothetical protein
MLTIEEILANGEAARKAAEPETPPTTETIIAETPVVETPAAETPVVETPAATTETSAAETPKSLEEILAATTPAAPVEEVIPESVKAKLEQLENEKRTYAEKLQSLESDPVISAILSGANKEQLIDIAAELKGKDYSKSSYRELMELEIAAEGYEGEELQNQLDAVVAEFDSLLPYQKSREEKQLREKFQSKIKAGESPTLKALEAAFQEKLKGQKTPEQIAQENNAIIAADKTSIQEVGKAAIGSEMYGVKFTQEELNEILTKEYHPARVEPYLNEKGELNAGKFIVDTFKMRNMEKMIEWAREDERRKNNIKTAAPSGDIKNTQVQNENLTPQQANMKAMGYPEHIWRAAK